MTAGDSSRLLALLRRRAVLRGAFTLSSGQPSPYYLDARLVTLSAEGSELVGRVVLDCIRDLQVDAVAGLTVGADPIVTAVALVAGLSGEQIDGLIVRRERKGHGAGRRIEGPWRSGMRVAVVDDTMTTGASALDAARTVEQEGGTVAGVVALIDRQQGGKESIEAAGYGFRAIFTGADVLAKGA